MIDLACNRCPLSGTRLAVVPTSDLPSNPRVLFVGRDPGDQEDKAAYPQPFIGPAGALLRATVMNMGLTDLAVYTNMVKCHTPKNRGPKIEEVEQCRVWLRGEVKELQPELIVAVGEEALNGLLGSPTDVVIHRKELKSGIKEVLLPWYSKSKPRWPIAQHHGQMAGTAWGVPVIPIYHPSAGLRNTGLRRALVGDVRAVARYLGVENASAPQFTRVDRLPSGGIVAVDTESSMEDGSFICFQLAWREGGELLAYFGRRPDELAHVLAVADRLVWWNVKYDAGVVEKLGIPFPWDRSEDPMVMAYDYRFGIPNPPMGLKERAAEDLMLSWPTIDELGAPETMDEDELATYGLCDGAATLLLYERYLRHMNGWANERIL